jgi:hypothetical protein
MKSIWVILITVIATAGLVGGGTYYFLNKKATDDKNALQAQIDGLAKKVADADTAQTTAAASEISYTSNDALFSVKKSSFEVLDKFTAKDLQANCDNKVESYFSGLLSHFSATDTGTQYDFTYKGAATQDTGTWTVTVIPNKIAYTNLELFKSDFEICGAGASLYPTLLSTDNLLFESSCGSGFDDGTGTPHGCTEVQNAVKPTLKLK